MSEEKENASSPVKKQKNLPTPDIVFKDALS